MQRIGEQEIDMHLPATWKSEVKVKGQQDMGIKLEERRFWGERSCGAAKYAKNLTERKKGKRT